MDPVIAIIFAVLALLLGVGLGWFLGSQPSQKAHDAAHKAQETTDALRLTLDGVRDERDQARTGLAALEADVRNHEKQIIQLQEAKEALSAQFSEVGSKLLSEAQKQFLERADQRFDQATEKSGAQIGKLLQPVHEKLTAYEESVRKIEKERAESYVGIRATIEQVRAGQERVQAEAARLVNSLRNAPKSRGRWGEQQLRNVLESCGLSEHTDFAMEVSVDTQEGRMRPDAIVRIPGGRSLIIDAKVSLNDYQDAFEAEDEVSKAAAMARHCQSMKNHIQGLGNKAYQTQFEDTPDYVIMFVPGEHFLSAALEHEPTLWDQAFDKKILLATPTNLVAIARTVASVWQQEALQENAKEIAVLGKEMHDRLATTAEHLKRVGTGLNSAVGNYNKFVGSFERNVLATGRKFVALNIETGKRDLESVEPIEALPRYGEDTGFILAEDAEDVGDSQASDEGADGNRAE